MIGAWLARQDRLWEHGWGHGVTVLLNDASESTVDSRLKTAEKDGIRNMQLLEKHKRGLRRCLPKPAFSHGLRLFLTAENCGLHPYLDKGDLIIDASDGNWQNTQRRQGELVTQGVHYKYVVSL